jgi:hypothetical protein
VSQNEADGKHETFQAGPSLKQASYENFISARFYFLILVFFFYHNL